jgi:hypothetical protein
VEHVGIGDLRRDVGSGDIARQSSQHAVLRLILVEVAVQNGENVGVPGAELSEQAVTGPDHLGEQIVLGLEMGVEAAAGQPGRQHDVVYAGPGIAAQPEQPRGMLEDLAPDAGGLGTGRRHFLSIIIRYDNRHIQWRLPAFWLQCPPTLPSPEKPEACRRRARHAG